MRGGGNCLFSSKQQFSPHFQSNSLVDNGSGTTTSPTITRESPHLPWFCGAAVLIKRSRGRRITPATRVA